MMTTIVTICRPPRTTMLSPQKAISDSNAVLRKLLDEESKTHRVRLQNIIDQMKKELQRRVIESAKLTHKIQEEQLRTDKLVKKKCNEMFVLRMERENEITKIFKKCLDVNASDKQGDANENVASHLLTSHPSTANEPQNDNTVADSPILTPRIWNNYLSIVINKTIKKQKKKWINKTTK
ncbi:PREDICTED: uncharacterized protein LOC105461938 [Wasmannia auropunctata]|uniref:uncharacterized protein LOC105461938 n=1 Tax=Wasmannia auropunctata TaxID=64793 RepID=UPI0005F087E7|nr:PREDICTED: uncharacterized protein LOC105461938 [Wasmannia auropunctata]